MSTDRRLHLLTQLLDETVPPSASVLRAELASGGTFARVVRALSELVGGIDILEALSTDPLPPEAIAVPDGAGELHARIEGIRAAIEAFTRPCAFMDVLGVECHTIVARLVARIRERSPADLLRSTPERVGAALVWLALHGNGDLGRRGRLPASLVWDGFGVSPASDLGRQLHQAAGLTIIDDLSEADSPVWLADVGLLHSRARKALVARRDGLVAAIEAMAARRRERSPVRRVAADCVALAGHLTVPQLAVRSTDASERHAVVVVLGNDESDVQGLALSVPDTHRLIQMLQQALSTTVHRREPPP